ENIARQADAIVADVNGNEHEVQPDTLVSMNMIAFRPSVFSRLRREFTKFLQTSANDVHAEFQIPDVLNQVVTEQQVRVRVLPTTSRWFGMTHSEDRNVVATNLQQLVALGEYPSLLWQAMPASTDQLESAFRHFSTGAGPSDSCVFTSVPAGHIHDTWQVQCGVGGEAYLLQRVNHEIFPNVVQLMDNIQVVTSHLHGRTNTLCYSRTADGQYFHQDKKGDYWRLCQYIDNVPVTEGRCTSELAAEAGRTFGEFATHLHELSPDLLAETIPRFHRLSWRLEQFDQAQRNDLMSRADTVRPEIELISSLRDEMLELEELWDTGQLPQRVTHNDTKLTNILFDRHLKAVCVIDLDTVMPGLVHFDFGDALRTIANSADEDAEDVSDVSLDRELATAFTRGYLGACSGLLTPTELKTLWRGPGYMTYLMALRFLTDVLVGDRYYKIKFQQHNLVRARAQFALLRDIRRNTSFLQETIINVCPGPGHAT
ncbi:MAG: phosphotransferase enzyme family protein, partial [Pirellulaceae bacterium]